MDNSRSTDWRHHDVLGGSHPHHYSLLGQNASQEEDYEPLPVPSRQTMQERWSFRQGIREETLQHRRIHRHGGMGETGRNIALVLRDREVRGASAVVLHRRRIREYPAEQSADGKEEGTAVSNGNTRNAPVADAQQQARRTAPISSSLQHQHQQSLNRVCYPVKISHEARLFAEYCSVVRYHSAFFKHLGGDDEPDERGERPSSSKAVSTISIAFSPDSQTMASTHGDHTVKITCCSSGMLLQTLEGHPRTPWTVKYHPIDSDMLASGCLGHQVRLWHWPDKVCLQMIRLEFAIISLSFHPVGNLLAVANGTRLHFWGYNANNNNNNNNNNSYGADQAAAANRNNPRGILTEVDQRHMLRCVHFPPEGDTIIIGGVNPTTDDRRRPNRGGIGGGGMSFYLRLWDFDVDAALQTYDNGGAGGQRRRAISNPRTFVPRALLYNDGGFDVSPDGKVLCACAEYWLPDGVDNAMELLQREEFEDDSDDGMGNPENDDADGNVDSPGADKTSTEREAAVSTPTPESRDKEQPTVSTPQANSSQANDGGGILRNPSRFSSAQTPPPNTATTSEVHTMDYIPQTPPRRNRPRLDLSPPSPPGRRFAAGNQGTNRPGGSAANNASANTGGRVQPLLPTPTQSQQQSGTGTIPLPPPPPPPGITSRPPHPLSIISGGANYDDVMNKKGRYVPHVVTVSLDTTPIADMGGVQRGVTKLTPVARGYRPRLGQLLEASPLDGTKASAVTCVKFSPSTDFCLIGYGVREPVVEGGGQYHPVTALYRVRGGMTHVSTMLSGDDDVNIARFHPDSGYGFVYGTKQGRVRVLSPRPWNFYDC